MFREARYFVEDLSGIAIATLGLVLGLVVGGFAAYSFTNDTPYTQGDLDRAGASRPIEIPAPAAATTDPQDELRTQQLEARLREARSRATTAEQQSEKLRTRLTTTTTSLDAAKRRQRQAAATTEMTVTGTLEVSWVLGPDQPRPAGCGDVLARYRVTVDDGSDTAAAVARPEAATETGRADDGETLSLSCRGTYSVTLTGTSDAVYGFSAVAADATDQPLTTVLATTADVEAGEGPTLAVTL